MSDGLFEALNEQQAEAVRLTGRPVLVLAGAGSGKTRVIVHKIAHLVRNEGLPSATILALTFTNKAAGEMRNRARALLGDEATAATIGTFHSVGLRILRDHASLVGRRRGFVVYDAQDQAALVARIVKDKGLPRQDHRPPELLHGIERAKRRGLTPGELAAHPTRPPDPVLLQVYEAYEKHLREANAVDFGDLLAKVVRLFEEHPAVRHGYQYRWRHALVDEFQDTNQAQYRMLRLLVEQPDGRTGGLTVVGDDDQAIYGWRGAHVGNILSFPKDFPDAHVVRLERNYRSSANILEAAGEVISHNTERHPKRLWTERPPGPPIELHRAATEVGEAEHIVSRVAALRGEVALSEIAVFYRTHAQSRALEEVLRRHAVPYRVVGGLRFYERAEVKDVLSYLRLLVNPADDVSLLRIVNVPRRGIGAKSTATLLETARARGSSLYEAIPDGAEALGSARRRHLLAFRELIEELRELAATAPARTVLVRSLERTGYFAHLGNEPDPLRAQSRQDNVRELLSAIEAYTESRPGATLAGFLDEAALLSDFDRLGEGQAALEPALTLMTVHSAKGLEFDVVFVAGLEQRLFPHANSLGSDKLIAEERRLFYVALTRARERAYLTLARTRRRFGDVEALPPSVFLSELPEELIAPTPGSAGPASGGRSARRAGEEEVVVYEDEDYDQRYDLGLTADEVIGRRVRHPTLGRGRIRAARDGRVQVDFERGGRHVLDPRFLELVH